MAGGEEDRIKGGTLRWERDSLIYGLRKSHRGQGRGLKT